MTVAASGTQSATVTTEHTLNSGSFTTAGTYVLVVDTTNMALGDYTELRTYIKVLSSGSEVLFDMQPLAHAQAEPVKVSLPVRSEYSIKFTLKQTAGTGRDYDWAVLRV
jgi:hypothetical protein